ncbi:MAG: hypothetical protein PHR77_05010 [Kiritimatiellae bacterium]|nr:hypothetical protein [Kiritimatiellia bacterium]MDD5521998.1 hypothetical protein [Kiritimatiellia bacterium]
MITEKDDNIDNLLLLTLQEGIPFVPHPLAAIGAKLGLSEEDVIKKIQYFFESGKARRFGAVFNSQQLGYKSTLCGVRLEPENIDKIAASLTPYKSITHCYRRECLPVKVSTDISLPNLWFTVTARGDLYEKELASIKQTLSKKTLLVLPAKRRFKIQVILDPRLSHQKALASLHHSFNSNALRIDTPALVLNETEKEVVRQLQDNLSPATDPIKAIARKTGLNPMEIVRLLIKWKETGVLRRIGLILYHQKIGFKANAMCVWKVPEAKVEQAGRHLADIDSITHCYERLFTESFPYNLYAMVHAGDEETIRSFFQEVSAETGLTDGLILVSVREYKKTSPRFFCEDIV